MTWRGRWGGSGVWSWGPVWNIPRKICWVRGRSCRCWNWGGCVTLDVSPYWTANFRWVFWDISGIRDGNDVTMVTWNFAEISCETHLRGTFCQIWSRQFTLWHGYRMSLIVYDLLLFVQWQEWMSNHRVHFRTYVDRSEFPAIFSDSNFGGKMGMLTLFGGTVVISEE